MTPEIVLVGNLLVDDLVFADGRTRMGEAGGAVLHGALAASLFRARVGCFSVRGTDYPAGALAALAARGVDLGGVRALGRPGLRTWLLYEPAGRRMVPWLGGATHEEMSPRPADLPSGFAAARAFHLAPMPFVYQRAFASALGQSGALVSVDPHLPISEATLADWRAVLADVDVLFLSQEDLQLDGDDEGVPVLRRLATGRLRHVVLKQGASGGVLYDLQEHRAQRWPPGAAVVVDPTGAGDAFAAAFVSALVAGQDGAAGLVRGAVAAGFAVSDWGAAGLLAASPADARARAAWAAGD